MNVSFVEPLRRAWDRSAHMLFRPFQMRTWLVLGFAAFLSEYLSGNTGSSFNYRAGRGEGHRIAGAVVGFLTHPAWTLVAIVVVACIVTLGILFLWLSSRGSFVFLDDVVRARAAIVEPWGRLARLGDSLFAWRLLFVVIVVVAAASFAVPLVVAVLSGWSEDGPHWERLLALGPLVALGALFGVVVAYVHLFLHHFVVPIMYRDAIGVTAAWSRFLGLLQRHPGAFLLYGVFVFLLWIVVAIAMALVGLMSCCVGFVLMLIPYVGSVVLLPVHVLFRSLGPEFLAQFGGDFSVFGSAAPGTAPTPPGPVA